jgi:hypothetical protein
MSIEEFVMLKPKPSQKVPVTPGLARIEYATTVPSPKLAGPPIMTSPWLEETLKLESTSLTVGTPLLYGPVTDQIDSPAEAQPAVRLKVSGVTEK